MDERQRRAWNALDLGPLWRSRDARSDSSAAETVPGAAHRLERVDTDVVAAASAASAARLQSPSTAPAADRSPRVDTATRIDTAAMNWHQLAERVHQCPDCRLCKTRKQTVFGVGSPTASWMFIGEAPGAEEDASGEPFVGLAGQLLDAMLASVGLNRERDVFIANVIKCRPPQNRDPLPDEVSSCEPYLRRQIELVAPRLIVVLGKFAAQTLLSSGSTVASLRGRAHRYQAGGRSIPVVVTYHPAYLLRTLQDKSKAWADLCLAVSLAAPEHGPG